MLLIGGYASVCKDGMPALPFVGKRESRWGSNPWRCATELSYAQNQRTLPIDLAIHDQSGDYPIQYSFGLHRQSIQSTCQ
jgi:hypothetical protein